jgi:hypothetical protein
MQQKDKYMNKSNTLWILATCVVVVGVIIYIANGISNGTSGNTSRSYSSTPTSSSSSSSDITSSTTNNNQSSNYEISTIEKFYNDLIKSNKVTANDIGNFTTFSNIIKNSGINDLKKLYGLLKSKGFSENEIGSLDTFYTKVENLRINSSSNSTQTKNTYSHNNSYSAPAPTFTESPYKGNQLSNGSSPLDACFGKGIYSGNATLTIKNGSSSDAIVCLYSVSSRRTIRNEYVRKSSSFTMDNIAQGYYKIRVFYGNDWNPTLENSCGTKGNFESDVSFSEFDGQQYFEDSYDGYTIATITLYTVAGGNASTSRISQSDFFNN